MRSCWDKMKEVKAIRDVQKKIEGKRRKREKKKWRVDWAKRRAKELTVRMTIEEKKFLKYAEEHFHYPLQTQREFVFGSHIYIADFYIVGCKLVIEIDGGYHGDAVQLRYDKERDKRFRRYLYHVIRFTNNEVNEDIERVFKRLTGFVNKLHKTKKAVHYKTKAKPKEKTKICILRKRDGEELRLQCNGEA